MGTGKIVIYNGDSEETVSAALGKAMFLSNKGEKVAVIQFLKGKGIQNAPLTRRLEPEIKMFHFEKSLRDFEGLAPEEKEEEISNIRNGLNYARKVLSTGQFDSLFLDEVLELIGMGVITAGELEKLLSARGFTDVFLTGCSMCDEVFTFADEIIELKSIKYKKYN